MVEKCSLKGDNNKIITYIKITKEKLQSINNLIEDVLEINKLKMSPEILKKEYFILSETINNLVDSYKINQEKEINFYIDPSCEEKIFANKAHIFNAINNLFKNSVIYSKNRVNIRVSVCKDKKHISIIVEDNGIGIPNSHQERVFDLFYRINTEGHGINNRGFGLGLNYVKWVAEAHGGRVKVESKDGKGSKFTLYIKAYEKESTYC
jgi:two-component system, OmpR family, phosphate regulon sensor histidine kinase PhoR